MKKLISILCAVILFGGLNLQASPVSPTRALDIAKKIFASQPATKAGTGEVKIIWDGEDVATKSVQPAFYVITRDGGGFVIIAGDDNVTPVLGISDHNEFKVEDMPENVKWWMERMKAYVRGTRSQSSDVKEQWSSFVTTKNASVPIGEVTPVRTRFTPEWNQNDPYNRACPLDAGSNRTITGCVALAISEILFYQANHKAEMGITMPAKGTGTVGGYSVPGGYVAPASYDLQTHSYDWDVIASFNASTASDSDKAELAKLIADIGAIVEAKYSKDDTGADSYSVTRHMSEHFYFNKAAYREMASDFSRTKWISKIKAEIDQHPLFYFGQSSAGGHAFVFDGYGIYNGADVFHVNFGWGGTDNGYYFYTNLDTSENGSENWSSASGALFDFYPNASSVAPIKLKAMFQTEEYCGVSVSLTENSCFYNYCIFNNGNTVYNGTIKFMLRKKDGTEQELDFNTNTVSINPQTYQSGYFGYTGGTLTGIKFGDSIICYYQDGSSWVQLGCIAGSAISEWPLTPAAFIKTKATYNKNEWFQFELMNNDYIYSDAKWTITAPDGTITSNIPQSDYEFQLTQTGKYKIEVKTATENIVTYITVN